MTARDESPKTGGHAVVIGSGMAGLCNARVLSDCFERVTLIERDSFPEGPDFRKGVPQSRHVHLFLPRGRQIAERLFPGLEGELASAGSEFVDAAGGKVWLTPVGLAPRFHSGVSMLASTRNLLEWVVRNRVGSLDNIRFLERTDVTSLLLGPGESVAGVKIRSRDGRNGASLDEPLYADLVVDASGRNSSAPRWLKALGYAPPKETHVNAHPGYATRLFERPEDSGRDWKIMFVQPAPPEHNRGGIIFPIEGGRWICSLGGMGGDYAPTDEEGFMEFARSLRDPMLYKAIKDAKPASPIHGYRDMENRSRHYEKLSRQPRNFLVTGDAACSFNPIYAQGMTTAAMGAEILEECLAEHRDGDFAALSRRFQKKLANVNAGPWLLAKGEDFRVRGTEGGQAGLSTRLTHRYMDRMLELSMQDLGVRRTFLEVFGMLKPPTALLSPAIAAKMMRETLFPGGKVEAPEDGNPASVAKAYSQPSPDQRVLVKSVELPTGVELQYVEQGDPSGVPVLLLHGLSDSWHSFELTLPHLPESIHAFALTQRGHGDSSRPQEGYRLHDFTADVAAFVDALGLEAAVVVGHSLGSAVAQRFAIDHSERTRGLVLAGSFASLAASPVAQGLWDEVVSEMEDPVDSGFVREFQESTLAQSVPQEFMETIVRESLKLPAHVWRATVASTLRDEFSEELGKIEAPTRLVWGDQDGMVPREDQEAQTAAIASSKLVVYESTGHAVHWEEPERFASDLASFVETCKPIQV